jgi:hypothetical protein
MGRRYGSGGHWELTYVCSLGQPLSPTTLRFQVFEAMLGNVLVNDISSRYQQERDNALCGLYCLYALYVQYNNNGDKNVVVNRNVVENFYYQHLKSTLLALNSSDVNEL